MIKLFAFDIDGTILDSKSRLTESSKIALSKLDDAGIKVVLASGRVFSSVRHNQSIAGISGPIVATNGSVISLDGENIYKTYPLTESNLRDLYNFSVEYKLDFHFYDEKNYYTNRLNLDKINHLKINNDYGMNYQANLIYSNDPVNYLLDQGKEAFKFQISGFDKKEFSKEAMVDILEKEFGENLYITSSSQSQIEIGNRNATKRSSIEEICKMLGIYNNEVAAIGDAYNDIPMVRGAEIGFAMGNAIDDLKKASDKLVADNDSGGILEAVNHILEANKNV